MCVKVAINGFGRIGRFLVRACLGRDDIEIVAINTRADAQTILHLLKYDSVHGKIGADVAADGDFLVVGGKKIKVTNITGDMTDLPWRELGVDVVMESTGNSGQRTKRVRTSGPARKRSSLRHPGKASTARLSWASTRRHMIRRSMTSYPTHPVRPTVSPRLPW